MFGGIVLAAGASSRMGSPKALTPVGGEPAVERVCRLMKKAGCDPVVAVLGADRDHIERWVPKFARVVVNDHWAAGKTRSVKWGLLSFDRSLAALVWPVDHPAVSADTVGHLLRAPGAIRVPTFQGRRGHPTLFGPSLREEILALKDDQPLHDVLHSKPERVVEVPVSDPGILWNLDRPEDLERIDEVLGGHKHSRPPA